MVLAWPQVDYFLGAPARITAFNPQHPAVLKNGQRRCHQRVDLAGLGVRGGGAGSLCPSRRGLGLRPALPPRRDGSALLTTGFNRYDHADTIP